MDVPSPSTLSSPSRQSFATETEHDTQVPLRRQTTKPTSPSSPLPNIAMEGENEQSPLLGPRLSEDDEEMGRSQMPILENSNTDPSMRNTDSMQQSPGKNSRMAWYTLLQLTSCFFGLQVAWSVEQAEISPFLLDLGISKNVMALIWIAGPLSGVVVQPYVGMKSDKCRSRFGKRRPFIVGGAVATIVSLMTLAWSFDLVSGLLGLFGVEREAHSTRITAIVVAVMMLYVLDFSINVLQASARTFLVDSVPGSQQDIANAWATRVSGVGDICGFLFGYLDLGQYLTALGDTQFKDLAFLTSVALALSVAVTTLTLPEPDARLSPSPDSDPRAFFKDLWHCMRTLPTQIKRVCAVQLAAWIGWFPVLFYTTTWIREIHLQQALKAHPGAATPALGEEGTRLGSLGLLLKAIMTLTCILVLPPLVKQTHHITLKRLWVFSHLTFALLTALTFMVNDVPSAIVISLFMGVPWALTLWIPFALIAQELKRREEGEEENGTILGIHNMAIALPQVIAIILSSVVFGAMERKEDGGTSPETVAWVLRVGGVAALVAAGLALRVEDE